MVPPEYREEFRPNVLVRNWQGIPLEAKREDWIGEGDVPIEEGPLHSAGRASRHAAPVAPGPERSGPADAPRLAGSRGDQRRGAPRLRREAHAPRRGARLHQVEQDPRTGLEGGPCPSRRRYVGNSLVRLGVAEARRLALRVACIGLFRLRRLRVGPRQGRPPARSGRTGARLHRPLGSGEGREDQGRISARLQGSDRKHLFVVEERLRRMGGHLRDHARAEPGAALCRRHRPAGDLALRAPDP